jgi:Site-specific DNA methylase
MSFIKLYKWYGGKYRMLTELMALIPDDYEKWYDLFMGSVAVTLNKSRHGVEFVNDLDPNIYNLVNVLSSEKEGKALVDRLKKIINCESDFVEALRMKKIQYQGLSNIDRAYFTFIEVSQSFNALRKNWRKGVPQYVYQREALWDLDEVHRRLQGVNVRNYDAIEVIRKAGSNTKAFLFLDPPYNHSLRGKGANKAYQCEMPFSKQVEMLKELQVISAKALLCGYCSDKGNDLYDNMLLPYGWRRYQLAQVLKSCQTGSVKDMATEYVWVNYELPDMAKYYIDTSTVVYR